MDEALLSYTTVGAYAGCEEDLYGKLSPGSFADFVILSDNPRSVPPEHLKDIEVEMTFVGGTRVYSK